MGAVLAICHGRHVLSKVNEGVAALRDLQRRMRWHQSPNQMSVASFAWVAGTGYLLGRAGIPLQSLKANKGCIMEDEADLLQQSESPRAQSYFFVG